MSIGLFILVITLILCTWTDLKEQRIYNKVLLPSIVAAFLIHSFTSGLEGLKVSFFGTLVGFLLLMIPYLLGGLGAGDVKLLAVIGAFGGPLFTFYTFIYSALIGGLISVAILIRKKRMKTVLQTMWLTLPVLRFTNNFKDNDTPEQDAFPYGIAISIGTMITIFVNGISI